MLEHVRILYILIATKCIVSGGLALDASSGSTESDINYVANLAGITLCGIKCGARLIYELDHYATPVIPGQSCVASGYLRAPLLDVICDQTRWNPLNGRVTVDINHGCCTIRSMKKRDSGIYALSLTGEDGKQRLLHCYKYQVIDPVTIDNITRQSSDLEEVISLTVFYSGDQPINIIWRKDEEDLPDGCMLTRSNQTLIVPYNVTGNFTVTISNPISMNKKNYTVPAITSTKPPLYRKHIAIPVAFAGVLCPFLLMMLVMMCKHFKKKNANTDQMEECDHMR